MYTRKEPTYESGKTQAWGRTPLKVNTNSFFSFSIAVSVFSYPLFPMLFAFLFSATTTLSFHSQALSVSFLILFSQCSFLPSFLLPFVLCVWIGGGWCGWGDYSSDQYCRAVGCSVNKMASVDGPSFLRLTQEWSEYPWLAIELYVWLRLPALTQVREQHFDCFISVW